MTHFIQKTVLILIFLHLWGCAASTPVLLAGAGNHQLLKYQQSKRLRAAAALHEAPDLLTYSVKGISENRSSEVINTYLLGYGKADYSQDIKSIALYQIAIIYMNQLNAERDDDKAKLYFHRHLIEFPYSILQERIQEHLKAIEHRKTQSVQFTPEQILAKLDSQLLLSKPAVAYDEELTPMSRRAIKEDRLGDANGVYLAVYQNPGSHDGIKAKSLYQLGLIYMSTNNKERSIDKSSYFFRKIIEEFPNSKLTEKAKRRISELLNQQANM
jgi:TPR repeat protein